MTDVLDLGATMLTLFAYEAITRYLNEIDLYVTDHMTGASSFEEEALTMLLCRALSEDYPKRYKWEYPLSALNTHLADRTGLYAMEISLENMRLTKQFEHRVAPADIGFVYRLENRALRGRSRRFCWLAQAKRFFPTDASDNKFTERSRLKSWHSDQHEKILKANKVLGGDFLRYLYYSPRLTSLSEGARERLYALAVDRMAGDIFDYNIGERIKNDLQDRDSSLFGGIFVASPRERVREIVDVYRGLPVRVHPFSWDLPMFLGLGSRARTLMGAEIPLFEAGASNHLICQLLDMDEAAVKKVATLLDAEGLQQHKFIPKQKVTITVTVGKHIDDDWLSPEEK